MSVLPDTIVALATPPGRSGIAVLRLSGPDAFAVARKLVGESVRLEARQAVVAAVRAGGDVGGASSEGGGAALDTAVVLPFRAPSSYTGEDVVEFSLHGSMAVVSQVLSSAAAAGARLARPGEFTLRSFLNGRLDLAQAEAVRDLVDAATPLQARVAFDQLTGSLSGRIAAIEAELFSLTARLEASIDFPDEGYSQVTDAEAVRGVRRALDMIEGLLATSKRGRLIREGATVVIAGRPNVGKSSLFNLLIGSDRAIVHPLPGTTRDVLSEQVALEGLRLTLVDTAGARASADEIEREGVDRAAKARAVADLILLILDRAVPLTHEDEVLLAETPVERRILVLNKMDLPSAWNWQPVLQRFAGMHPAGVHPNEAPTETPFSVSCVTGSGLASLISAVALKLGVDGIQRDEVMLSNTRHEALLADAREALRSALNLMEPAAPEEVVLSEIQRAREALEEVTGKRSTEDLLDVIFSTFCVGK